MSSYKPLADFLARKRGDQWDATFADVEQALGRPLPQSAYRYNAWWANQTGPGHSQTHGWRSVGWRTAKLDLERRRVRFERDPGAERRSPSSVEDGVDERLVEQAMRISGISDRQTVINAALRKFIERTAIQALIEMGGTMPDLVVPPRERPSA